MPGISGKEGAGCSRGVLEGRRSQDGKRRLRQMPSFDFHVGKT